MADLQELGLMKLILAALMAFSVSPFLLVRYFSVILLPSFLHASSFLLFQDFPRQVGLLLHRNYIHHQTDLVLQESCSFLAVRHFRQLVLKLVHLVEFLMDSTIHLEDFVEELVLLVSFFVHSHFDRLCLLLLMHSRQHLLPIPLTRVDFRHLRSKHHSDQHQQLVHVHFLIQLLARR